MTEPVLITRLVVEVETKRLARGQADTTLVETTDAQFRSLQVGDHADRTFRRRFHGAHRLVALGMLFVRAMGEVEAKRVGPGIEQGLDAVRRRTRRSERR